MKGFNTETRTNNAAKSVGAATTLHIFNLISGFVYRTIFLMVLSKEYLGINGLFTNILSVLSLAELGIGYAIGYRMFESITLNDVHKVSCIMQFYKKVYRVIACIVAVVGLAMTPLIQFLIKDTSEIPSDVNIYVVYGLFVFQSIVSYLFAYRTCIFGADQKGYINSISGIISGLIGLGIRIGVLYATKSFIWTLVVGIAWSLAVNIIMSIIATKMYSFVFKCKDKLDKETISLIKKDTLALTCHKVGGIIVGSTDNILLSTFVGIGVLGIYSNYTMILGALAGLLGQLMGSFGSSIGNVKITESGDNYFKTYRNLEYINLVIISCVCVALFTLFNPFITVWLGEDMLLGTDVVALITLTFFLQNIRQTNGTCINATGLFKYDKLRPLIEATINLVASIILVNVLGIAGIFLGTIISNVCVLFWREPYILFKKGFHRTKALYKYFVVVLLFLAYTVGMSALMHYVTNYMPNNLGYLIFKFLIVGIVPLLGIICLTFKTKEFQYFIGLVKRIVGGIFHRGKSINITETVEIDNSGEDVALNSDTGIESGENAEAALNEKNNDGNIESNCDAIINNEKEN